MTNESAMPEPWIVPLPTDVNPSVFRSGRFDPGDPAISGVEVEMTVVSYDGKTSRNLEHLKCSGTITFTYAGLCARCSEDASAAVETTFATLIDLPAGTITALDLETPAEDFGFERIGESEIDLSEDLRQRIYLAVPSLIYCRADCRGLCTRCGHNLNESECGCDRKLSEGKSRSGKFDALAELLKE